MACQKVCKQGTDNASLVPSAEGRAKRAPGVYCMHMCIIITRRVGGVYSDDDTKISRRVSVMQQPAKTHKGVYSSMASHVCHLCQSAIPSNCSVFLFSRGSVQQKLSSRFSDLLDVTVESSDGLPHYVCCKCKQCLEIIENAAQDLVDFRSLARGSYSALLARGILKRVKDRSGDVGVSPDIAKARPPAKTQTMLDRPTLVSTKHNTRIHLRPFVFNSGTVKAEAIIDSIFRYCTAAPVLAEPLEQSVASQQSSLLRCEVPPTRLIAAEPCSASGLVEMTEYKVAQE